MKRRNLTGLALIVMLASLPAWAQRGPQQQQSQQQQQQQRSLSGRITSISAVKLRGDTRPHLIARLETNSGQVIPVDLGHRLNVGDMLGQIDVEQPFRVSGRIGRINNTPVLFAQQIRLGDRTFPVQRVQQQQRRQPDRTQTRRGQQPQMMGQQARQQQQQVQQVRATVQDVRRFNLRGAGQHVLAKVRTSGGRTLVIDFGRSQDAQGMQLQPGEQVVIFGQAGRINRKPVLVAHRVDIGGRSTSINRSGSNQQQRQSQSRSAQQ